ncbi:MAG: hypothetical protein DMF53_08145 [Acidobacteria bacterium]|nr:MAG: hypothetical protein DMF53_08145 [Acidobacteriota bacterium]
MGASNLLFDLVPILLDRDFEPQDLLDDLAPAGRGAQILRSHGRTATILIREHMQIHPQKRLPL